MLKCSNDHTASTFQRPWMARIQLILAEHESQTTQAMLRQTDKIIRLTWGLFWLTLALSFVAAVQLYIMLK
jgi:hypothetical protein